MKRVIAFCFIVCSFILLSAEKEQTQNPAKTQKSTITEQTSEFKSDPQARKIFGSPSEAKDLLQRANDFITIHGKEEAFKEFNNRKGEFFLKDLYIFVIDMEGVVLVHSFEPQLVNNNQLHLKDVQGKFFIKEFIEQMRSRTTAWVEYKWHNYDNNRIESKLTYLMKIDDTCFMGCGVYYSN